MHIQWACFYGRLFTQSLLCLACFLTIRFVVLTRRDTTDTWFRRSENTTPSPRPAIKSSEGSSLARFRSPFAQFVDPQPERDDFDRTKLGLMRGNRTKVQLGGRFKVLTLQAPNSFEKLRPSFKTSQLPSASPVSQSAVCRRIKVSHLRIPSAPSQPFPACPDYAVARRLPSNYPCNFWSKTVRRDSQPAMLVWCVLGPILASLSIA